MTSEESRFDLAQNRSPVMYWASNGSAWSGTIRGLLHAKLANGETTLLAECSSPQVAMDLAKALNELLEAPKPELRQNAKARQELFELAKLAELLPGRDNKNNWARKMEWLMGLFS